MPQINTTYAEQVRAFQGMIADTRDNEIDSYVQGEASASIPFGVAVAEGTAGVPANGIPNEAINMVNASSVVAGAVVHSHAYSPETQLDASGVRPDNLINVMRRGRVYMRHEGTTTKGSAAFVRHTSGAGGTIKGYLRSDADTATAVLCRGLIFAETKAAVGDGLVLVEVDMNLVGGTAGLT
jgi:hypothetical protein